jgi:hypothetical protein
LPQSFAEHRHLDPFAIRNVIEDDHVPCRNIAQMDPGLGHRPTGPGRAIDHHHGFFRTTTGAQGAGQQQGQEEA